ncbi:MAG TPA: glycosyltransferase family 87 protein [Candidatus Dormibacteraeota bacterium]
MLRPRPWLLAWVALAAGNALAQPLRAMRDLAETDYVYAFMTAGRMLHEGTSCLYCHDAARRTRATFIQTGPALINDLYTNPPLAAWLIQPITLLPPRVSLAIFLGISIAAVAGAGVILATRVLPSRTPVGTRYLVVALALTTLPAVQALAIVNWNALLVLALAGSAWAAVGRRPLMAGALASILLVKPQTVWLVPVVLIASLDWRALAGFALGAATWVASTLLIIGPGQIGDWVHNDLPAHANEARQTVGIPGIVADVLGSGSAGFACAALLLVPAAALAWRWRAALRLDLAGALGLAVAASALCAPHIWPEDMLLVAVPLVLWARRDVPAALAGTGALSVAYLLDTTLPLQAGHFEALALAAILVGLGRSLVAGAANAGPAATRLPHRRAAAASPS